MKALVLAAAAMLLSLGVAEKPYAAELSPGCHAPGQPLDESGFITLGGIRQWVTVDGQDCANPVVLVVHGGPGNPNTPFAHTLFGDWAKDFTIVQWDQRGSGKTYGANRPGEDEPLTIEQMTADGVEMARYATQRFGKRKVIIMGGSWGSALAVNIIMAAPDLFSAYVGTAQLANYQLDMAASYTKTLALARAAGDTESMGKLESLGAPPWNNPRAFGVLRRITRKYEALATDAPPNGWFTFAPGYDTAAYEADYTAGEDYSFLNFVGLAGDGMGPKIDLRKLGLSFAMPVYMLQGESDLVTPPEVSKAYFDDLTAPKKVFMSLARTGHDPNQTMIDAQYKALKQVRDEAMAKD
jgi:pimeloyl-ACP methyl ester carboxylesterase